MDSATRLELVNLLRNRGIAALGTLHGGAPLVSMVLYAASPDLSALFIHVSRLAQHTGALLGDRRVGLLIADPDKPSRNPLSMARVSILADAEPLEVGSPEYDQARAAYLAAHPTAAFNFELGDFLLIRLKPTSARFVAGFGRIVDIDAEGWAGLTDE
jgi:putative heme iron utilization protein